MTKQLQRRWKIGQEYKLEGSTGRRRLRLVGRGKTEDGRELLMFHPLRAAKKAH